VANHLRSDINSVEDSSRVDTNLTSTHLWDDQHVTQVSLDDGWLLIGGCFLLGFSQLLDQTHGLSLETSGETSSGSGVYDLHEIFGGHVQESVQLISSVGKLSESSLSL
jgi:hypothetical protein